MSYNREQQELITWYGLDPKEARYLLGGLHFLKELERLGRPGIAKNTKTKPVRQLSQSGFKSRIHSTPIGNTASGNIYRHWSRGNQLPAVSECPIGQNIFDCRRETRVNRGPGRWSRKRYF